VLLWFLFANKMNANDLKDQGNMYFAARRFNDAVSCYTKAIVNTVLAICGS